ncbi:MAG: HU family DNA-binding protein [Planctomycetota bacterium]|jgi:DNA-binding protein HU-beta
MNKSQLIELVSGNKELKCESKAQAERMVNAMIDGIRAGLKKDGKVQIIGFGSFVVRKRAARMGRNPATGEKMKIKASTTVGFTAGKALKDQFNRKRRK